MIFFFVRVGCGSSLEGHDSRLKDKPQWAVGAKQFPQQQQCLKYQKDTLKAHGTRTPINMAMRPPPFFGGGNVNINMHYIFWSFVDASLCVTCCALDHMQDQPKPTVALVPDSKGVE